jgi:hypothetical protein
MRALFASGASLLLAVGLLLGFGTAVPRVAMACSCIGPQPLDAYAGEETVIMAGEVVGPDEGGIRFAVENWFSGTEPAELVRIAGDWENGGMCGLGFVPAEGTRWVGVAWRPPSDDPLAELDANQNLQVSICQPFMDLDTPEGQALFEEAVAAFGDGGGAPPGAPQTPPPAESPPPQAPTTPAPTPAPTPEAPGGPNAETVSMIAVGGVIAVGALVLVLVAVLGRRRPAG